MAPGEGGTGSQSQRDPSEEQTTDETIHAEILGLL
jgi:hypothetical protein